MPDLPPPDECANCGAPIPRGAKACPECGADERTGWRETSIYDGLELPDTAFESEGESESEGDRKRGIRRHAHVNGIRWYWWVVAILVITALVGIWVW